MKSPHIAIICKSTMLSEIHRRSLHILSNVYPRHRTLITHPSSLPIDEIRPSEAKQYNVRTIHNLKQHHSRNFLSMYPGYDVQKHKIEKHSPTSPNVKNDSSFVSGKRTCEETPRDADGYMKAIRDLNSLQTNTQTLALAKYKIPGEILPLFHKQLKLAGIDVADLDRLNIIHVTGTKGKGSTCAFAEKIIRKAGYKTGFYNSPHLIKVNERIKINGSSISDAKFCHYFRQVYDRLIHATREANVSMPTYFSFLTILAYHVFLEEKVECAIIEVGIGGQYDPTNIVQKPVVCGISTLDYDHTAILGDTIESIAWSKAGIAKKDCPLITINQEHQSALDVIRSRAKELGSPLYICRPIPPESDLRLGIESKVQHKNAALACELALKYLETRGFYAQSVNVQSENEVLETNLNSMPSSFLEAMESCSWPGRCQVMDYLNMTFFLDGAHTKASMQNCVDWFRVKSSSTSSEKVTRVLMVNIIGDRNRHDILKPLALYGKFDLVIFSTNKVGRLKDSMSSGNFQMIQSDTSDKSVINARNNLETWTDLLHAQMLDCSSVEIASDTSDCLRLINNLSLRNNRQKSHVLVTGSLHFVGAVLETLTVQDDALDRGIS